MNEELQSTNEELETVNEELRERSDELKRVNVFLESILASLRGGVVVVDPEFLVLIWNRKAEDLWGLRSDEVRGRNLLNLDIGLPVERLKSALRGCLTGESRYQEAALPATNRRGKAVVCRVTCTPMTDDGDIKGVILVMDDDPRRSTTGSSRRPRANRPATGSRCRTPGPAPARDSPTPAIARDFGASGDSASSVYLFRAIDRGVLSSRPYHPIRPRATDDRPASAPEENHGGDLMLVLSRKINESIIIGEKIRITLTLIRGQHVRIAVEAPKAVPILRSELLATGPGPVEPGIALATTPREP